MHVGTTRVRAVWPKRVELIRHGQTGTYTNHTNHSNLTTKNALVPTLTALTTVTLR